MITPHQERRDLTNMAKTAPTSPPKSPAERQIDQILAAIDQASEIDLTTLPPDRSWAVEESVRSAQRQLEQLRREVGRRKASLPIPEPVRPVTCGSGLFLAMGTVDGVEEI